MVFRYIGSDKAIADLPFMNGNVRHSYLCVLIIVSWSLIDDLFIVHRSLPAEVSRLIFSGVAPTSARSSPSEIAHLWPLIG
jgi:hypothetical protein